MTLLQFEITRKKERMVLKDAEESTFRKDMQYVKEKIT